MARSAKWYADQRTVALMLIGACVIVALVTMAHYSGLLSSIATKAIRASTTKTGLCDSGLVLDPSSTTSVATAVKDVNDCLRAAQQQYCNGNPLSFTPIYLLINGNPGYITVNRGFGPEKLWPARATSTWTCDTLSVHL